MDLALEKEAGLRRKLGERRFSQKTLHRENVKALVGTSDSNLFTGFRSSSEIAAKFRVKTTVSLCTSAPQANGVPRASGAV